MKTSSQLREELYSLVFRTYMIDRDQNDTYAMHLAKVAADYYFLDIAKYQRGWCEESLVDDYEYLIDAFTKRLA